MKRTIQILILLAAAVLVTTPLLADNSKHISTPLPASIQSSSITPAPPAVLRPLIRPTSLSLNAIFGIVKIQLGWWIHIPIKIDVDKPKTDVPTASDGKNKKFWEQKLRDNGGYEGIK